MLKTILFLALSLLLCSSAFSQMADNRDGSVNLFYLTTPSVSPAPLLSGRTAAMASPEFSVRDSLSDYQINPAKFPSVSSVSVSPALTGQSYLLNRDFLFREFSGGTVIYEEVQTQFRDRAFSTFSVPVGVTYRSGRFYAAGSVAYVSYSGKLNTRQTLEQSNTQSDLIEEIERSESFSGTPFQLSAGYRLSQRLSVGLSYQRTGINRSESIQNMQNMNRLQNDMDQNNNFGKLGVGIEMFGGQTYLLGGIYRTRSEHLEGNSAGNFWTQLKGALLQAEHMRPVTQVISAGLRITLETREQSDQATELQYENYFDRTRIYQFAAGMNRTTNSSEVGLEAGYQMERRSLNSLRFDDFSGLSEDVAQRAESDRFYIRAGIDFRLTGPLRLQAGLLQNLYNRELSRQSLFRSEDNFFRLSTDLNDQFDGYQSGSILTGGASVNLHQIKLQYIFRADFRSIEDSVPVFMNQLTATYRF
ncbi:MAG: hypothetical protein JJU46_05165 [Balneolaceae bacterium]|nr:hypothetical protein [Balneolaceae bacterium]MCH8548386.1 hypothetical protein [Balneolaceae bacterium]